MSHVTLKQAKELKEAGYPQDKTEAAYQGYALRLSNRKDDPFFGFASSVNHFYAAPSVEELMEWLPSNLGDDKRGGHLQIMKLDQCWKGETYVGTLSPGWSVAYVQFQGMPLTGIKHVIEKNDYQLIDALVSCALWVLKKKLSP